MELLSEYLAICWLSGDPMELPRSPGLFKKSLFVYFLVYYLLQANMTDDPIESSYEVFFQIILTFGFIALILALNKTLYVYMQVITALLVCANFISIALVPVMVWLTVSEELLSYYLFALLILWYYVVVTYIFKHALILNIPASLVLALFYFIATYLGAFALGQMI